MDFFVNGLNHWDAADLLIRLTIGGFFAISGYHKLFNKARHEMLVSTMRNDGIPLLRINQWFVPCVELVAGFMFAIGLLTVLSALLLGAICLVATCTDGIKRIRDWKPIDKADAVDDLLYLPEVLYGIAILVAILVGPGYFSLDNLLFGAL